MLWKACTNQLPNNGDAEAPTLKQMPKTPIASPLRKGETISATYAVVPVGLKPVEKP